MDDGIIISDYFSQNNNNNDNLTIDKTNNIINIINKNENNVIEVEKTLKSDDIIITGIEKENKTKIKIPQDIILEKEQANKLTQKLLKKTRRNEKMKFEEFFIKKRHYLIMSDGGKPVYSRYGDPIENNSIFATLSAMITKYTIFNTNDNEKENLNVITNNKNKIVFLKKGQLIFIALSKKNDCTSLLFSQLEYLYFQLMSILTISFYSKLEDNPSKCLSTMGGTENLF